VGVNGLGNPATAGPPSPAAAEKVVWHDLDCGSYQADLPLWRELAGGCAGPILEVGAGTGRLALDLARAGHRVTALDIDGELLGALDERAVDGSVQTVCADARSFDLGRRDFALCIAAMQTIQLLGGSRGRAAFLRRARAHLRPCGLLACAIVTAPEAFDSADGAGEPSPESVRIEGVLYMSRATRVSVLERTVLIEREHRVIPDGGCPEGAPRPRREVIELDRVSARELEREAVAADFQAFPAREVASTEEHVGSTVVVLGA